MVTYLDEFVWFKRGEMVAFMGKSKKIRTSYFDKIKKIIGIKKENNSKLQKQD